MRSGTIAFVLGILAFHSQPTLTLSAVDAGLLTLAGFALAGMPGFWRRPTITARIRRLAMLRAWPVVCVVCRWVSFALIGFGWTGIVAVSALAERPPASAMRSDVLVDATVVSIPKTDPRATRFVADVVPVTPLEGWTAPKRARLAWYTEPPQIAPGDRWRVTVRLRQTSGFRNPGGFDYERWLFTARIGATGYVRDVAKAKRLLPDEGQWVERWRYRARNAVRDALLTRQETLETPEAVDRAADLSEVRGDDFLGILVALSLGLRHDMTAEHWAVLQRTGTAHLMAISGLHIGLAAVAGFAVARALFRLASTVMPRLLTAAPSIPPPFFGVGGALCFALGYALMAGLSVPTQRALVMVIAWGVATLVRRSAGPSTVVAIAMVTVLAIDPLSILSTGFWLSFGAVGILLYAMSARERARGIWWRWGRAQWAVTVGLTGIVIAGFGQFPLLSPVVNAFAIPWVSVAVVPFAVVGTLVETTVPGLGRPLLYLAELALTPLWYLLTLAANAGPLWRGGLPAGMFGVFLAVAGALVLLAPPGLPSRWLGGVTLLCLLAARPERPGEDEVWITTLDVGQGLSVVLETHDDVLVYDTGAKFGASFDAADAALVPFLRSRGWSEVTRVVLSHGDGDHVGGYETLREAFPIRRLLDNETDWPSAPCVAGASWYWSGVRFDVLHPPAAHRWRRNNASCVIRVSVGPYAVLLTGDIERAGESALLQARPSELRADVLVVGHHGSRTSSTSPFLTAVGASVGIIGVGFQNRYRLPSPHVLRRLERHGVSVYRTDLDGAVQLRLSRGAGVTDIRRFRAAERRYWHR